MPSHVVFGWENPNPAENLCASPYLDCREEADTQLITRRCVWNRWKTKPNLKIKKNNGRAKEKGKKNQWCLNFYMKEAPWIQHENPHLWVLFWLLHSETIIFMHCFSCLQRHPLTSWMFIRNKGLKSCTICCLSTSHPSNRFITSVC